MSLKNLLPLLIIFSTLSNGWAAENSRCAYPTSNPCYTDDCCEDIGFEIYGDYLYWAARKCDLDYALPYDGTFTIGEVYQVNPSWDSGFRVGLTKDCCPFMFGATYTWYHPVANSSVVNADGDLAGTFMIDAITVVNQADIQLARADWNLTYNTLDLLVGYQFCTTPCFNAAILAGFRAAFINQHFNVLYSDEQDLTSPTADADLINMSNRLNGYGLDVGLNASYALSRCIEVFGTASIDVLAGHFDRRFIYTVIEDGGTIENVGIDLTDSCIRSVGVCNIKLGLTYIARICNFDTSLSIGYEFHNWFNVSNFLINQNESGQITIDDALDCYGFDGLFVRLGLSF